MGSLHGLVSANEKLSIKPVQLRRTITIGVGTCGWTPPELWGFADASKMQRQDLKSVDIFALGLIWAQLLACHVVLECASPEDPQNFLLLEILKKIDQPMDANLEELGYTTDTLAFIQDVVARNMDKIRNMWMNLASPEGQQKIEKLMQAGTTTIDSWIKQTRNETDENFAQSAIALIRQATRFIYRDRPCIRDLISDPYFSDLCRMPGLEGDKAC